MSAMGSKAQKRRRAALLRIYGHICVKCKHTNPRKLTLDHIVPRMFGGLDDIGNLQLMCGDCNGKKGASEACDYRPFLPPGFPPPFWKQKRRLEALAMNGPGKWKP